MRSASRPKSQLNLVNENLRNALSIAKVPLELQDSLATAVQSMATRYSQNDLRPSELNAGDFIEAAVRILQFLSFGVYTPLDKSLPSMPEWLKTMESAKVDDSFRINVPRVLNAMYSIRSRRGVSHIAGKVSANRSDAGLLLTNARWVLAEFVRLLHDEKDHEKAQRAVDLLATVEAPIVEDFDGVRRVITGRKVPAPSQVLVLLLTAANFRLSELELQESVSATEKNLRMAVRRLSDRDHVHVFPDGAVQLTGVGRRVANSLIETLIASK